MSEDRDYKKMYAMLSGVVTGAYMAYEDGAAADISLKAIWDFYKKQSTESDNA